MATLSNGAFLTMEHLLATMVSVPPLPGRMHIHSARGIRTMGHLLAMMVSVPASLGRMHIHSARGVSDNGALVGVEGYSTRIAFVGRVGYGYLFLYRLLTLMRGPDIIFSELKLASLKYYTP
jgi:hypothetical protein